MRQAQTTSIYRSRKTGEFRIQPFGRLQNGTSQPFGEPVRLPNDVSDEELLKSVLENLAKNDQQEYVFLQAAKVPKEEWRRELREDQLVGISRVESGYRLVPSERMGNGFGSIDDKVRTVPSDEFLDTGGKILRELFDEIP